MSDQSIADVLKSTVQDAQDLLRGEIALAKAELRAEVRTVGAGAVSLAAAAVTGLVAVVFLLTALAWVVPPLLGWPVWTGFAIVGLLAAAAAAGLAMMGKKKLNGQRHMPLTTDTMKENLKWMRARTS
ncbi:MAG TPA: phage holin family protein [Vicinamibacterales bacterium]|nr:phage holin family protein [Vicinamibacterales bacterium]